MNLFEIDDRIEELIDEETGVITDVEALEALEMERDAKISNIGCLIKESKAEQDAIKKAKQDLDKRLKVAENRERSCKTYLATYLNGAKFKDGRVSISYRSSTSTEVDEDIDLNKLPDDCKKITIEPSKTAIKERLEAGEVIEGCRLVQKNNLIVR